MNMYVRVRMYEYVRTVLAKIQYLHVTVLYTIKAKLLYL